VHIDVGLIIKAKRIIWRMVALSAILATTRRPASVIWEELKKKATEKG